MTNKNSSGRIPSVRCIALLVALLIASPARADVDLVTIPTRDETQLTIYNSEDITLVRERRLLTVKPGVNRIQFAWSNTLIDPTSIEFRILDHHDQADLVDTTFPAGRNDALQWNVRSTMSGKLPIEIRYFTSGVTWSADYVGIANADETKLHVTGYVRVTNNSGEQYDNAQTRLVVGKINLVEKIADLATRPAVERRKALHEEMEKIVKEMSEIKAKSMARAKYLDDDAAAFGHRAGGAAEGKTADKPAEIAKEGVSEYFLFTIAGRENIEDKQPKRLVALNAADVPLECIYKLSDQSGGQGFTKFYRFKNVKLREEQGADKDKEKKLPAMENLGVSPLPNGAVKLFFEYANKDLTYVGGTETRYVPIGDRVEVNVGPDHDITIDRRLKDKKTSNIVVRQHKRRIDNQFVEYYDLFDYDETEYYEETIVSGKPTVAKVELERQFDANVVLWSPEEKPADWESNAAGAFVDLHGLAGKVERVDARHAKYFLNLLPGKKMVVSYNVTYKRRAMGPELNVERKREAL